MPEPTSPWSFKVKVAHVAVNPVQVTMSADAGERASLAQLWDIPEVLDFSASAAISRWKRDGVRVKGHVDARIVQNCVVTLDPVEQILSEDFEALFVPENSRLARMPVDEAGELFLDPDGPDLPETYNGDSIDVGAVAAEFAALAIDSYPRKPEAAFASQVQGKSSGESGEEKVSPFAVLKDRFNDN